MSWTQPEVRLTRVDITLVPGAEHHHVGVGYEVLVGGRVVHTAGLTVHASGAKGLPLDLEEEVERLWRHCEDAVRAREGLVLAESRGPELSILSDS